MSWPNFLIIGAQKAGTSSLYEYLREHPQVYMSPTKEPGYFKFGGARSDWVLPEDVIDRDEYLRLFDGVRDEIAVGEASTGYLNHPMAPSRIREAVPDAKLIAVLRNPVDRAFSAYSMRVASGEEARSFPDAIAPELDPDTVRSTKGQWKYLRNGFYGRYLTRYFDLFPAHQLRIFLYEDLSRDPRQLVCEVFDFLAVDPSFVPDLATHHNTSSYTVKSASLDKVVRRFPGKDLARRVVPTEVWVGARRSVRRRNSRIPEFPAEVRRRLVDFFRDDILLTEQLIARDLSAWTAER